MNNNDVNYDVNDAIRTGISGEAVTDAIEEVMNKNNGEVPKQFKDTVAAVADMKSDKQDSFNPEYASDLVKNNSNRIKEALKDGIEPQEIAVEIAKTSTSANTTEGYKKLNFITKLISKMKRKQRKKDIERQQQMAAQIQNENPEKKQEMGGIQKVYTYTNNKQN